jgi:hypothetical protein
MWEEVKPLGAFSDLKLPFYRIPFTGVLRGYLPCRPDGRAAAQAGHRKILLSSIPPTRPFGVGPGDRTTLLANVEFAASVSGDLVGPERRCQFVPSARMRQDPEALRDWLIAQQITDAQSGASRAAGGQNLRVESKQVAVPAEPQRSEVGGREIMGPRGDEEAINYVALSRHEIERGIAGLPKNLLGI